MKGPKAEWVTYMEHHYPEAAKTLYRITDGKEDVYIENSTIDFYKNAKGEERPLPDNIAAIVNARAEYNELYGPQSKGLLRKLFENIFILPYKRY